MGLFFSSKGNFENIIKWLHKSSDLSSYRQILEEYGNYGVSRLAELTPKDRGITASSWSYEIIQNGKKSLELVFYNSVMVDSGIPLAILIQIGHATKNGGYVQPVNYINPALKPIFIRFGKDLVERFKL